MIGVLRAARLLFLAVAKCLSASLIAFDDVIPVAPHSYGPTLQSYLTSPALIND